MPIPTTSLENEPPPYEHCCFCDTATPSWTKLPDRSEFEQVACCPRCAKNKKPAQVPTKADWFEIERQRHPPVRAKTKKPQPQQYQAAAPYMPPQSQIRNAG